MSFILDALKKSEAERQRQAGPTLLELRITRPPRRYPLWSLIVGALLAVNVAVLLTFLLRRPPAVTATAAPAPVQSAPQVQARAAPARAAPQAPAAAPVPVSAAAPPSAAASAAPPSTGDTADAAAGAPAHNPADYQPALPPGTRQSGPAPAQQAAAAQPAGAVDYSSLPNLSQIGGNIPAMRLDLLDYSQLASERYALINMQRVREGDVLPDGARVLAITPNGVAVDYRGQQFLLRPGGTAQ